MLETLLEELPAGLERRLATVWGLMVGIGRQPARAGRLSALAASFDDHTLCGVIGASSQPGCGLIGMSATVVSAFVEFVLGHRTVTASATPTRRATPFEASLLRPLVAQTLEALGQAVAPAGALALLLDGWGAVSSVEDGPALHLPLTVDFGGVAGRIDLILPLALLTPLDDALNGIFHGAAAGADKGADADWREGLERALLLTGVTLVAVLHEQAMPLGLLQGLKPGATLTFDAPAEPAVGLRVEGLPVGQGRLGRAGARIAIRLDSRISATKEAQA